MPKPHNVSLFAELERVLDSKDRALACAIAHGQVSVDGYTIQPTDDRRWSEERLRGRLARVNSRTGRLFGSSRQRRETGVQS